MWTWLWHQLEQAEKVNGITDLYRKLTQAKASDSLTYPGSLPSQGFVTFHTSLFGSTTSVLL